MKLIIGLGNPGEKYALNRHNVGFLFLEWLKNELSFSEFKEEKKFFSQISEGEIKGKKVILIRPQTFMNLSGKAIISIIHYYNIPIEDIIVIYDDKDLEFGITRFRENGTSGGHNGIKDMIKVLGTEDFARIKIGVANEKMPNKDTADFVLSNFSKDEIEKLWNIFTEVDNKLIEWIKK